MRRLGVWIMGLILCAGAQEHDAPRRLSAPARVSADTPFSPACDGTQTGRHYLSAAVEPWVAVDPHNPQRMIGAWQQDRWSNGGASGLLASVSVDGGETWRQSALPFSNCAGGEARYERVSDSWVTIAPDGTIYAIGIALTASQDGQALMVSRSSDGLEWSAPVKLIEETSRDVLNDKESLTADPTDARYVYAVWDRLSGLTSPNNATYRGPTYFARTTDGGASWEAARVIFDPGANAQTIGNQIVVLPDGTLIDAFALVQNATAPLVKNERLSVAVVRSTDQGATWSAPIVVSTAEPVGVSDVKTGKPVRSGSLIPEVTVDAVTGALYAVWEDGRFSGGQREGIAMARSDDGGLTWSAAAQVNQVAEVQAFTPSVAARGGEVAVTYYDFRKDTNDAAVLMTSYWRAISIDGGRSWTEAPMSDPFDLTAAVVTDSGYFLGDYQGLAAANGRFLSLFVTARAGAVPSSVFATWRPAGGDVFSTGRTEVNRHALRREIERRAQRK